MFASASIGNELSVRVASVLMSIPSPSIHEVKVGPLTLRFYGLMIGFGVIAAVMLARRRLPERNIHPDTALEMVMWVVPAGLVGARMYHVITDWKPIGDWYKIWEGGLGIPGGIALGLLVGVWWCRRHDLPVADVADAMIPGIPLAQAIGRLGNWWNQELFGRPTDLPWGLEIDPNIGKIPEQYKGLTTFHPTVFYEALWNVGLTVLLIWLDRRGVLKRGKLIWVYTGVYAIGRLWIEALRIDNATRIAGVRVNLWTMGLLLVVSVFMLLRARNDGSDSAATSTGAAADDSHGESDDDAGGDSDGAADDDSIELNVD